VKVAARPDKTRNPSDEACWVSRLRKNLTSGSYGEGLETGWALRPAPRQSFTRQLFFKWIKQNLRIKTFLGTSTNAVITQIWIALCVYLLLAFIKFQSTLDKRMRQILQLLQINLFEKRDLYTLLRGAPPDANFGNTNQLAFL
jgi:hypothetical protein